MVGQGEVGQGRGNHASRDEGKNDQRAASLCSMYHLSYEH